MRAAIIERYGGPEVLALRQVPEPEPGPTEVVVRVRACGVCYHDLLVRQGKYKSVRLPRIPGHEAAGEVSRVGAAVARFRPGDRVVVAAFQFCGLCPPCRRGRNDLCAAPAGTPGTDEDGGYAEYMKSPAVCLTPLPATIGWEDATAIPCVAATALTAVRDVTRVSPGERVLITGAGGGLGVHAIQLARIYGGEVLAATSSADKVRRLEELGAGRVVCAPPEELPGRIREATDGRGVDAVIDCVGTGTLDASLRCLAAGGRLALIGAVTGDAVPIKPAVLVLKSLTIGGTSRQADLADVIELVASGRLRLVVSRALPLEEAAESHRLLESRASFGRIALVP
jgi:2-desacetyl-2-hydroxyethyl bacteriochlorophyllide A dehydrogenase